jgi:hypothetical protein
VRHRYLHPARTWSQYAHTGEREAGRESTRLPEGNPAQPHRPLPSNTSHLHTPSSHVSSSDLGRGRKGAPQRLQLLFQARVQGTRSVPAPNSGRRPEPGACERTPVRQPAQPSTTPESLLGAHAAGILRLDGRKRLSTARTSPPPPRHPSRLPSYTGYPFASAATDARVERLRGPRDAGAAQRGDDGCLTA